MSSLSVRDFTKSFGTQQVLRGVSLDVQPGEIKVIMGSSGCGKILLMDEPTSALDPVQALAARTDDPIIHRFFGHDSGVIR